MSSFISTIEIEDSIIHDITLLENSIEAISSTLKFKNLEIYDIDNQAQKDFILITFDSTFSAENVKYKNSNSILFTLQSSQAHIDGIQYTNVSILDNQSQLMRIFAWNSVFINDVTLENTNITGDSLIYIYSSTDVSIKNIQLTRFTQRLLDISESQINIIENLNITQSSKSITVKKSIVNQLVNCTFLANGSEIIKRGGALTLLNSEVTIRNSSFYLNKAEEGGSISFECTSLERWKLEVSNSTFINNTAIVKGGVIYYNYLRPVLSDILFENNTAPYGNNYASYPVRIGKRGSSKTDTIILNEVGPGIILSEPLELVLFDPDDQITVLEETDQITITSLNTSETLISGINSAAIKKGVANFDALSVKAEPGSTNMAFRMSSNVINTKKVQEVFNGEIVQQNIFMDFRFWKPGEEINVNECHSCSIGTYTLLWNSTQWKDCMDDANWIDGEILVSDGHWRNTKESTFIPEWINKDAWLGGYDDNSKHPVNWEEGYDGILWSQCKISNGVKYEKINDFEWRKWPDPVLNSIRVIGLFLLVFSFFMVLIIINVKKTKESELSVLFRILTNYLQLITTSVSMSASLPTDLTIVFSPVRKIGNSSETFLSFDCFISDYEVTGPFGSNPVFKLFLLAFLPILLFGLVALIWLLVYKIKKTLVKDMVRYLVISFVSIVFLLHPKLTEQSINSFRCVKIDEGVKIARMDSDIECYSSTHLKWWFLVSLPILLIWVITLPIVSLVIIYKNLGEDEDNKARQYFLILYQGLRPERFYWEFINTLRKVLILSTFLLDTNLQIAISSSILMVTIRAQVTLRPYKREENNKAEIIAVFTGFSTITGSLIFMEDDGNDILNLVVYIMILFLNFYFIMTWFYLLIKIYEDKYSAAKFVSKEIKTFSNKLFSDWNC